MNNSATNSSANNTSGSTSDKSASEQEFRAFIIDQLTKIQEQNEKLNDKVDMLEKEQEQYYLSQTKKMEGGFRDVKKCVSEITQVKKLFKEVVGIMTGERVRFLDHSAENAVETTEPSGAEQDDTQEPSRPEELPRRPYGYVEQNRERSIIQNAERIRIKTESNGDLGTLPSIDTSAGRSWDARHNMRGANDTISEDFAGNGEILRISRQQVLNDQRELDAIMEAQRHGERELENALRIEQSMNYKMNRAIQSVYDVAKEYYEGFPGKPSLLLLDRRFGSTWRRQRGERTMFAKRKCIINRIEDILRRPAKYNLPEGLRRNQAIKVMENLRLGNNNYKGHVTRLSLSQLYEYLSKKMDSAADYSLHITERGVPRREILMKERERAMINGEEVNASTSGTVGANESSAPPTTQTNSSSTAAGQGTVSSSLPGASSTTLTNNGASHISEGAMPQRDQRPEAWNETPNDSMADHDDNESYGDHSDYSEDYSF